MRIDELKSLGRDELVKKQTSAIIANCSEALHSQPIYRGVRDLNKDLIMFNPGLAGRKSRNTSNHYTLLMSNLPSWKNYPKRDSSLICTTSLGTAYSYKGHNGLGGHYRILPVNGSKIGICQDSDLWDSMPQVASSLSYFNDCLSMVTDSSYSEMLASMINKKSAILAQFKNQMEWDETLEPISAAFAQVSTVENLVQMLNKFFDPKANGFKLKSIKQFKNVGTDNEVWTSNKCFMIKVDSRLYNNLFENLDFDWNSA